MKKNFEFYILAMMIAVASCGKSSSDGGAPATTTTTNDPGYESPLYGPPSYNWASFYSGEIPPNNCGRYTTIPSACTAGAAQSGYSYCGNQWFYHWDNAYWAFSAFGQCGDTGMNGPYNSGWVTYWNSMGTSQNKYMSFTVPHDGKYYISFMGTYSGQLQGDENLDVQFENGKIHSIDDLDQYTNAENQRTCKVNTAFVLTGGKTYKLYLNGNEDSVNNAQIRLTDYWPVDVSTLCN